MPGTCPELLPSSQVMKRAAFCVWKTELLIIFGTRLERYVSPAEVLHPHMSSQLLGVSHMKLDAPDVELKSDRRAESPVPAGTTFAHSDGVLMTCEKYTNGLCIVM